jgi:hypothetical protein
LRSAISRIAAGISIAGLSVMEEPLSCLAWRTGSIATLMNYRPDVEGQRDFSF